MRLKLMAVTLAGAMLAACGGGGGGGGGGDGNPAPPTVEGAVVKGPVSGSTVCAFLLKDGVKDGRIPLRAAVGATGRIVDGCHVTGANGRYLVELPADTTGDVLLEASGGQFCSNEAEVADGRCAGGARPVSLEDTLMHSVVTVQAGVAATVYTTPLTTAAVANAGTRVTAARFGQAFTTLAGQVIGNNSGVTPATVPTAATQPYLPQVATHMAAGGTLASAVASLAKGTTTFTATPGGGDTQPGTVGADLVGSYTLVFKVGGGAGCAGTGCTFTEGQQVTMVVHGDGRLTLPGGKVLTAPFNRSYGGTVNLHEIIWSDADAKIEYALSDNLGTFNEINVGDMARPTSNGLPRFLGQLRAPTNDTLSALTAHAGTYQFGFQYSGAAVAWTSVTIGTDGAITFEGGAGPNVRPADIEELFDRVGCCGRIDVTLKRDLQTPANGIDGSDKISLHLDQDGKPRSISYDLGNVNSINDDTGVRLAPVAALTHDGTSIPSGRAVNGTVNGTALKFAPASSTYVSATGMGLMAEGGPTGPSWLIQLSTGTLAEGNHACNSNNTSVQATLRAGAFPVSTRNGGRCTITITRIDKSGSEVTLLEGRFVAEMFDGGRQNTAPAVVRDGVFRWTRPAS